VDLNEPMLQLGKQKIGRQGLSRAIICMRGNAEHLHFKDRCLDAVTVAFGIRNLQNIGQALAEIYRVLKPGGRLICLEFSHPSAKWLRKLYDFYSFRLLPLIGTALTGDRTGVYRYLPASIRHFPGPDVFSQIIQETGFRKVEYCNLSGGIVAIHIGVK
jgi:demethylmenaquinone methyltransferase / 2-methoxy-6-polyprenyl-1,4-benzoquinol methylase